MGVKQEVDEGSGRPGLGAESDAFEQFRRAKSSSYNTRVSFIHLSFLLSCYLFIFTLCTIIFPILFYSLTFSIRNARGHFFVFYTDKQK